MAFVEANLGLVSPFLVFVEVYFGPVGPFSAFVEAHFGLVHPSLAYIGAHFGPSALFRLLLRHILVESTLLGLR